MKMGAGFFFCLLFAIKQPLQGLQAKPEMIVIEPIKEKALKGTWRSFPIGSYAMSEATTVQISSGIKTTHIAYTRQTLVALSDKKAVLEMESHVEGVLVKSRIEIAFDLDFPPKEFMSPPRGSTSGSEPITVGSNRVACKWVEIMKVSPGGQTTIKSWYSAEVPGYIVRMIIKNTDPSLITEATIQVTDFKGN